MHNCFAYVGSLNIGVSVFMEKRNQDYSRNFFFAYSNTEIVNNGVFPISISGHLGFIISLKLV